MTTYDVIVKLIGPIVPIGDSSVDEVRFENLKQLCDVVNELVADIDRLYQLKDRPEASIKRSVRYADKFLTDTLGIKE